MWNCKGENKIILRDNNFNGVRRCFTATCWQVVFFSVLFVFCIVALATEGEARTSKQCLASQISPKIHFNVEGVKTTINRSKTSEQITNFAKSIEAFKPSTKGRLLGLAYTQIHTNLGVEIQGFAVNNTQNCIRLATVRFEFGNKQAEIFVARKYRPGTCAYKAILAHEKKHMEINETLQKEYAKKIKKELQKSANRIRPYHTKKANEAAKSMANRLVHEMTPFIKEFREAKRKANYKIDTPRSYKRVRSTCGKW